jgi:hypothetical protein
MPDIAMIMKALTVQELAVFDTISGEEVDDLIHDAERLIMLDDEEPQTQEEVIENLQKTAAILLKIGKDHVKMITKLDKLAKRKTTRLLRNPD